MIRETLDEGMPVVQVEMHVLADRADRTNDVEHVLHSASHRLLDVCGQISQPAVLRAEAPQTQARMAAPERGRRLPDAEVADIDAATDSFSVAEPLRHLDEPPGLKARGVLEKDEGATRPLAQTRIELAHHPKQAVCLFPHLIFVMHDEAGDAARESVGELPDYGAARLVQHIDTAVQMDHRPVRVRRHEPQNVLKLVWRVGIYLSGQAHLGEAESSQLEQRIVPRDTSLEQAMNRPEHPSVPRTQLTKTPTTWAGRIHDPHPTVT